MEFIITDGETIYEIVMMNGPLLVFEVPDEINAWRQAVYAAVKEAGYEVFIHIHAVADGLYSYTWGPSALYGDDMTTELHWEVYNAFHKACVVTAKLWPKNLGMSTAVAELLNKGE